MGFDLWSTMIGDALRLKCVGTETAIHITSENRKGDREELSVIGYQFSVTLLWQLLYG